MYTQKYEALPKWLKIVIQLFLGAVIGGIYRIVRFVESKDIVTLVVGLIITFTGIGNAIGWIVDLVCLILNGEYTLFVD